jgi:hypothetical protein
MRALQVRSVCPRSRVRNRLSDNVGDVKSVVRHLLWTKRHFALVEKNLFQPTTARLVILAGQNSVPPKHLFDRNCDHDYQFELLSEEERGAHSISSVFYCTPWRFPPKLPHLWPTLQQLSFPQPAFGSAGCIRQLSCAGSRRFNSPTHSNRGMCGAPGIGSRDPRLVDIKIACAVAFHVRGPVRILFCTATARWVSPTNYGYHSSVV